MKSVSKIFIDTAPFIYLLEDNPAYSERMRKYFSNCFYAGTQFYTSFLTIAEYCVMPYRLNYPQKIDDFERFIIDAKIELIDLTKEIAKSSAQIRAKYSSIKTMDALQIASALQEDCSLFLTNDKQLMQVTEINCLLVEDL
ncbi:MAG: PIN domain-containing protein [Neisseriaceae bacterium]|nr:PIN domain-containing protein [Neisseriaceae bacterium]